MARDPAQFETFRARCRGEAPAAAALARRVAVSVPLVETDEQTLWSAHREAMERYRSGDFSEGPVETSLLDLKVELGQRLLGPCRLCWLRCPVDRRAGETGACGLGAALRPYQDFVHLGEELELIPTHAIYLAGCNYRCVYCSDWSHVDRPQDDPQVEGARLARSIEARRAEGALSVSFIGGLPDVNLAGILRALGRVEASVPVVWNSNMSGTPEAHDLLEGVVDAYVADLKYGAEPCAHAGSGVKDSLGVVQRNLRRAGGEAYLIVRHLVLPDHVDCCALPVLDWLAAELPGVRVNLMDQYRPIPEVRGTPWDRRPSPQELERALGHARALGLDLRGPGRIEPSQRGRPLPTEPVGTQVDSFIEIGPDGRVVIENLSPELAALARELGGAGSPEDDLDDRGRAAQPWLDPGDKP